MVFTSHDPQGPSPDGTLLYQDKLICVSSYTDHADGQYVPLEALGALSHIVGQRPLRSAVSERLSKTLADHGITRRVAMDVPDFSSVFRCMAHCELVAFLPANLVRQNPLNLKRLRVDLDIPAANVFARWHPRLSKDARHQWLRRLVLQTARHLNGPHRPPEGQPLDDAARGA